MATTPDVKSFWLIGSEDMLEGHGNSKWEALNFKLYKTSGAEVKNKLSFNPQSQ